LPTRHHEAVSDKSSFFAELKRRNVYRVAVGLRYRGVGLFSGNRAGVPVFDVPNWTIRLLCPAHHHWLPDRARLAWMFELTPEGIKRTATADAMPAKTRRKKHVWIYVGRARRSCIDRIIFSRTLHAENKTTSTSGIPSKSIAVLPSRISA